ncbi:uncharacterized protein ALTATR162_LOCUS9785 [Alternaria atra]|uniref:Uncharacterized protein n=1 Tax=Alternaria atra TaxID=119953 RepID=A0A8J2IL32_9PLEO|nr:uncharacterized protein ALTATR162_LOCUS9785 [Alternaria atra]CAG5181640.1 unnamed protein product [Alternaria atra]
MLTIYALETSGWPIIQSFQLLFGSATLKVVVQDDLGSPAVGVAVLANTTTFLGIGETAVTDPDGTALFKNVPSTTISLKADGSENKVAVGSLAGGLVATVNMKLLPLHHPIAGAGGFDVDNGTSGWTGGTTKTITKRDGRLVKRDTGLVVSTNFSPDVQTAYQSFDLAEGATLVYLKYQFQTEEVPGGFFGTQFNDYFSIVIRADDESSTTVTHSMNELGLGAFDAAGSTKEFTTQMALADAAQYVEFMVAVSNVADELYQSQLVVRKVGVCDKCASCDDCPDLAKCQDACKNPPANSCTFYRSCAEETLKCGSSGYPIAYGELACYRFQNNIDEFSTVGKAWVTNTEQCLQEALVPFLNCDTTCDAVMFAGSDSLYTCYVQNDICSLEGMDYVRILNVLETEVHRGALRAAIGSQEGCSKAIVKAIDTDIQKKVADGAAGSDVLQNAADAHALALARKFYLMIIEDQDLDVAAAVKYIKQIQDTAAISPFSARDPNILTTDYLRHNNYNDYQWTLLVGGISPLWIMFAEAEGVQMYHGYTDPASPAIVMDFAHTFATMGSVYVNGENSAGDITGWLGDLFTFYGDWKRSGVASGKDFCAQNLGQQTQSTFPMADLRGDADGYNIAMGVKNGAYPSIADGFAAVMQGGYASRFKDFFQARFQGSATVASSTCMDYMTAKALDRPLVWKARRSLAVKFGVVPFPEDIPRADLQGFCDGFADALANFAANG